MKKLVLVAGHFPPSNLTAGHRSRLWATYLKEYGWDPTIVTTHWDYYEESLDFELEQLIPDGIRVIRTRALPVKPVRIIGDIGVRAFYWHYRELARLASNGEIDFLHITIPSNFSAPLGRLVYRRYGIPYGIDYIDPWVHKWPGVDRIFSRAWFSYHLGNQLEPWSVKYASAITGVAEGYYAGVLERNPDLRQRAVAAAMPYGIAREDFEHAAKQVSRTSIFSPDDGKLHLVYAGAMLPDGYEVLDMFLRGVSRFKRQYPEFIGRLKVHFVGTGSSLVDPESYNILPRIKAFGLGDCVEEVPARIPYCDVLRMLRSASGVLIVGSTKSHYTPSKLFQAVLSERPVLALLHRDSTGLRFLQQSRGVLALPFTSDNPVSEENVSEALKKLFEWNTKRDFAPVSDIPKEYTARDSARRLAEALDVAYGKHRHAN